MHSTEWKFYNSVGGLSFPIAVGHNPKVWKGTRQGQQISHLWTLYIAVLRIRIFFDRIQIRTCIHKYTKEKLKKVVHAGSVCVFFFSEFISVQ